MVYWLLLPKVVLYDEQWDTDYAYWLFSLMVCWLLLPKVLLYDEQWDNDCA